MRIQFAHFHYNNLGDIVGADITWSSDPTNPAEAGLAPVVTDALAGTSPSAKKLVLNSLKFKSKVSGEPFEVSP
mgnify:CR=1 FL=1